MSTEIDDKGKCWVQGYACAVANLWRMNGGETEQVRELWQANYVKPQDYEKFGIDELDAAVLRKITVKHPSDNILNRK